MTRPVVREYKLEIAANSSAHISMEATFLRMVFATATPKIELDHATAIELPAGMALSDANSWKKTTIINDTDQSIYVTVVLAFGEVLDSRLTLTEDLRVFPAGGRVSFGRIEINSGQRIQLVPENPLRLDITIANQGTAPVYIGNDTVSFWGAHMPIAPGYERKITTTSELFVYAQAAGTQIVTIMENEK